MTPRTMTILATGLTLLFLADTGWQVYRAMQDQPTRWWGMVLLVPIVLLLKRMSAATPTTSGSSRSELPTP